MPKRTNEFQQLMHYIYGQMVPEGATVAESVFIKERDGGSEREVDILIEHEVAGTKLRIAVECRDRSRRDSIEWIDSLIGKFRDLAIDKVVAVNRVGFSKEAVQKASANGIDTRTLEKALDTDWPEEFVKLGIIRMTYRTFPVQVRIDTEPPLTDQAELELQRFDGHFFTLGHSHLLHEVGSLVVGRTHVADRRVPPGGVVEALDVLEDGRPRRFPGGERTGGGRHLGLERGDE